ncbi:MAG: alanine racemase [Dysosmobacter sp.]
MRHCANTGATAYCRRCMLDMVRPGLLLYGVRRRLRRGWACGR